jgi:hypothetical protein
MKSSDPIPEGTYHLRLDKATYGTTGSGSKNPGAPKVDVQWTVFGPESAEEFVGRKVFETLSLSGDGTFKVRSLLEQTGETEDFILEETDQLLTREVAAVVIVVPEMKDPTNPNKIFPAKNEIKRYLKLE